MSTLCIPYINILATDCASSLHSQLQLCGAAVAVSCNNWSEQFAYAPSVKARLAFSDSHIFVAFDVEEEHIAAVELADNGRVWEDSCVEFFVANPVGAGYFNFELNCIGTLLAAYRTSRESATHFSAGQLSRVVRHTSLEHKTTDIRQGGKWWAVLAVPFELLGVEVAPASLRANLYKCGDNLARPHYLSWAPIELDKPNFHCPDYFGELILDRNE